MKLIHWLFALCLFTASFDIFLVFNVGGTVRFAQLVMLLVCVGAIAKATQNGAVSWPTGGLWLLLWCTVQVVFLPLGIDLSFSIRYVLFLFYTVGCYFAVVHLYGRSGYIERLMRVYLWSYVFVAAFGVFQMVAPMLHLGTFLVTQWIVHDRLPRINGFCYEPSYFATYMMPGWITVLDLRYSKARLTAGKRWKWLTIFLGAALFLSTSKTAWLFMMLEGFLRGFPRLLRWFKSVASRISAGRLVIRIPKPTMVVLCILAVVLAGAGLRALGSVLDLNIFLSGTGLNNTASHSVDERHHQFQDTVDMFEEHPWIGRSLGGVSSRIAERHGVPNDGKKYLGFPVVMDLLAASGIIGIVPFLIFLWCNTIGFFGTIRSHWPDERAKWLRALVRGTIFIWLVMGADQNVLRLYLWFHMSVVAAVAVHLTTIHSADSPDNPSGYALPSPASA
jgi:hypothetical protein